MNSSTLQGALGKTLEDVQLLQHPWYQRWEAGELSSDELRDYAEQYRHFEAALPEVLETIVIALPAGTARDFVADNLADETSTPSHVELFAEYINAVGGSHTATASPAMEALVRTYREAAAAGPVEGLSAVMAYETQAAAIAKSKGDGLRSKYGMTPAQTHFWDTHATMDVDHADWSLRGLAEMVDAPEDVTAPARAAAVAWWAFLDERQALVSA